MLDGLYLRLLRYTILLKARLVVIKKRSLFGLLVSIVLLVLLVWLVISSHMTIRSIVIRGGLLLLLVAITSLRNILLRLQSMIMLRSIFNEVINSIQFVMFLKYK
jgi:small neutral amino acid transporter SnatA (MarC family)